MINIFRKKSYQASKYIKLISDLELDKTNDIEQSIVELKKIHSMLFSKNVFELKLVRTEIFSLLEDYKQISLFTSMITVILAAFTIVISILRELPAKLIPGDQILSGGMSLTLILYTGVCLLPLAFIIKRLAGKSPRLNQLNQILELVIIERELLDQQHTEAYIEYAKHCKENSLQS